MTPLPPLARRADEDPDPPTPPELGDFLRRFSANFRGLYRTALVALLLCFLAAIPSTFDFLVGDKTVWLAGWLLIPVILMYGPLVILARRARHIDYPASGYAACILALFAALLPILPISLALLYFSIRGLRSLREGRCRRLQSQPIFTEEESTRRLVAIPAKGYICFGILSIALGLPGSLGLALAGHASHGHSGWSSRLQGDLLYLLAALLFLSAVVLPMPIVVSGFRFKRGRLGAGYTAAGFSIAALLLLPVSPAAWGLMASAIWTIVALGRRDLRKRRRPVSEEDDL